MVQKDRKVQMHVTTWMNIVLVKAAATEDALHDWIHIECPEQANPQKWEVH